MAGSSERCKERVYTDSFTSPTRQCSRRSVSDGYCLQHHPDTLALQERKAEALRQARRLHEKCNRIQRTLNDLVEMGLSKSAQDEIAALLAGQGRQEGAGE